MTPRQKSALQPAHPWDQQAILAEIRRKGSSVSELSRSSGLKRGTLYSAFYKRYPKGQATIAGFIGVSRHDIWPQWYGPNDDLLPLQSVSGGRAV